MFQFPPPTAMLLPSGSVCLSPSTHHAFMPACFFIRILNKWWSYIYSCMQMFVCGCALTCGFQRREQRRMAITAPSFWQCYCISANYLTRCYKCAVNETTGLLTSLNQSAVSQVCNTHFEQVAVLVDIEALTLLVLVLFSIHACSPKWTGPVLVMYQHAYDNFHVLIVLTWMPIKPQTWNNNVCWIYSEY